MQETLDKAPLEDQEHDKQGAITIKVAAVSSDHCAPISPNWVKRTRPAVSGRLLSLLVTIKRPQEFVPVPGHRRQPKGDQRWHDGGR